MMCVYFPTGVKGLSRGVIIVVLTSSGHSYVFNVSLLVNIRSKISFTIEVKLSQGMNLKKYWAGGWKEGLIEELIFINFSLIYLIRSSVNFLFLHFKTNTSIFACIKSWADLVHFRCAER